MHCETDMELMYDPSELAEPGDDVCPVDWARRVVSEAGK